MSLFIVATPIGNLDDLSIRAANTLSDVELILCEDTRVTKKLLTKLEITTPTASFHQHSSEKELQDILDRLAEGTSMALVTDAGTPGISDPGGKLVEAVVQQLPNVSIVPIPGPSALITALSVSGFPSDKFVFLGFPPHKKGRNGYFDRLSEQDGTIVLYESTHRILKTLDALSERIGDRALMVGRELTKMHETLYRGTADAIIDQLQTSSTKGEFVIVIAPAR